MTEVVRFTHYSTAENVVTNNILFVLKKILTVEPKSFLEIFKELLDEDNANWNLDAAELQNQVSYSYLAGNQNNILSVPDGEIKWDGVRIAIETKLNWLSFNPEQLTNHALGLLTFQAPKSVLLLFSPAMGAVPALGNNLGDHQAFSLIQTTFQEILNLMRNHARSSDCLDYIESLEHFFEYHKEDLLGTCANRMFCPAITHQSNIDLLDGGNGYYIGLAKGNAGQSAHLNQRSRFLAAYGGMELPCVCYIDWVVDVSTQGRGKIHFHNSTTEPTQEVEAQWINAAIEKTREERPQRTHNYRIAKLSEGIPWGLPNDGHPIASSKYFQLPAGLLTPDEIVNHFDPQDDFAMSHLEGP